MQETSYWPTHSRYVVSEQSQSNWQHPNAYDRERKETQHPGADECGAGRHPQPFCTLATKVVKTDPGWDVILEAVHFLVKIGNPHHARLNGPLRIEWLK